MSEVQPQKWSKTGLGTSKISIPNGLFIGVTFELKAYRRWIRRKKFAKRDPIRTFSISFENGRDRKMQWHKIYSYYALSVVVHFYYLLFKICLAGKTQHTHSWLADMTIKPQNDCKCKQYKMNGNANYATRVTQRKHCTLTNRQTSIGLNNGIE